MGGRTSKSGFSSTGKHKIAEGKDISESFSPPLDSEGWGAESYFRGEEHTYMIEEVLHQQGFDGLPQVMNDEDFEKAVKASGFIAMRGITASTQEELDGYHEQLVNGKFYVRCGGGDTFGKGLYCAADYNGKLSDKTWNIAEGYANDRWGGVGKMETFTLTPNAKIGDHAALKKELLNDKKMWMKFHGDVGSYAAAKGYDAIKCTDSSEGAYTVVFNRSKMIIKESKKNG